MENSINPFYSNTKISTIAAYLRKGSYRQVRKGTNPRYEVQVIDRQRNELNQTRVRKKES